MGKLDDIRKQREQNASAARASAVAPKAQSLAFTKTEAVAVEAVVDARARSGGRPPKGDEKRGERLVLHFTKAELEQMRAQLAPTVTLVAWARATLLRAAQKKA